LNTKCEAFLSAKAARIVTAGLQNVRTSFGCTNVLQCIITYKIADENKAIMLM